MNRPIGRDDVVPDTPLTDSRAVDAAGTPSALALIWMPVPAIAIVALLGKPLAGLPSVISPVLAIALITLCFLAFGLFRPRLPPRPDDDERDGADAEEARRAAPTAYFRLPARLGFIVRAGAVLAALAWLGAPAILLMLAGVYCVALLFAVGDPVAMVWRVEVDGDGGDGGDGGGDGGGGGD